MTLLKLIVSISLITLALRLGNWHATVARLAEIDASTMLGLVIIVLLLAPVQALRWKCVLRCLDVDLGLLSASITTVISYFFNQTLPSSIGGDVIRVWRVRQTGAGLATALSSVILDRVVAVIGLVVLVLVLMPWIYDLMPGDAARLQLMIAISTVVLATASIFLIRYLPEWLLRHRLADPFARISTGLSRLLKAPAYGITALFCALVSHLAMGAMCFWIAKALSVKVGLFDCILLVPPVMLVAMVPASIGGWGVREGAMVVALGLAHVAAADALSISVIFGIAVLISGLPGGIIWLFTEKASFRRQTHQFFEG